MGDSDLPQVLGGVTDLLTILSTPSTVALVPLVRT
jgi:hypothetical protein